VEKWKEEFKVKLKPANLISCGILTGIPGGIILVSVLNLLNFISFSCFFKKIIIKF